MTATAITQYRITFTQPEAGGDAKYSTRWFDSLEEAKDSRWIKEDNAKIESRIWTP